MASKIAFKDLSVDKLLLTKEDDPYIFFPALRLKNIDLVNPNTLVNTTNHARGTKDTGGEKVEAMNCSVRHGWDRASWPIPFMEVDNKNEIFDRRHTLNSVKKAGAKLVPAAEYERVSHPDYDWLSDRSIREAAAVAGNVYSPVTADAKNHHFVHATINILNLEKISDPTREQIYTILKLMGVEDRYNTKSTIKGIVTTILKEMSDNDSVALKVSHHTDKKELEEWVKNSNEFHDNLETDETVFIIKNMSGDFNRRYAADVLRKMCECYPKEKKLKILCYSLHSSTTTIKKDRETFLSEMIYIWNLIRDVNVDPFSKLLNKDIVDTYKLNLEDFDMEIWIKDQIEGETEPFLVSFD